MIQSRMKKARKNKMPILNNRHMRRTHQLESYIGRGPIGLFKDLVDSWLDSHPEATTSVQDGSITSVKLADHAITAPKIADESVSTPHIQHGAITGEKIAFATITDENIANNAVCTSIIQDGAITENKLSPDITMVAISNDEIDLITTL